MHHVNSIPSIPAFLGCSGKAYSAAIPILGDLVGTSDKSAILVAYLNLLLLN